MTIKQTDIIAEKENLHPRNKHRFGYNFKELSKKYKELQQYVFVNSYHKESIDFSNPLAIIALNKALLLNYYGISNWDLPENYLCPPIPGRADYIHYVADLLGSTNENIIPKGKSIKVLDVGIGANCIYPIIGQHEYGWSFVGSDIDAFAIKSANNIIRINNIQDIYCRIQPDKSNVFHHVIKPDEKFDLTICNPPFHSTRAEAINNSAKKLKNLSSEADPKFELNFGGQNGELWTPGGEKTFILKMIHESKALKDQCFWFSSLVSKKLNLPVFYHVLKYLKATDVKTIQMKQGQKVSRILAWTFLDAEQQKDWREKRWNVGESK